MDFNNPAVVGALCAVLTALVTQYANIVMARRKASSDHATVAYNAVQQSQQLLLESMFRQIKGLEDRVGELSEELAKCNTKHAESEAQVSRLREELRQWQAAHPGG